MSLYDQILTEARPYLGGNTERFVARQCQAHLKLSPPDSITPAQLPELGRWVEISAGLLMAKDQASVLRQKIEGLAK